MSYRFVLHTRITAPVAEVFDAASDIDAHLGSMKDSGEQAVGGVTGGRIGLGQDVTWRARHFGLWWTMTSRITEWDEPHSFVDEQTRGPFKSFHHLHTFADQGDGCLMTDTIKFSAPFGPIGELAAKLVLGPYLKRLIASRNQYLKDLCQA